ncbi:hypothetical protein AnigIFM56816_011659 [Aspergillus niger]|nr:hypothetical protein AnigIFM56816_011659 [Aspergillus niger]
MHRIFNSVFFNFEFLRILSMTPFDGADIAECLSAAGQIRDRDVQSWNQAWHKQAEQAEKLAHEASQHGEVRSAQRAFMRAANYFRAAGYMFDGRPQSPDHDTVVAYGERAAQVFRRGALLLPGPVVPLEIPFEDNLKLPGYLYLPSGHARRPGKNPVLIALNGADSIQEEVYFMNSPVLNAGYALLTFDGPGQGMVLRRHQQPMREDYEVVTSLVLDFLFDFAAQCPDLELDLDLIALTGASMGGYFALRGAADPRVKACVALDAFYDMWEFAAHHTSPALLGAWQSGWIPTGGINKLLGVAQWAVAQLRWELALTQWMFGVPTPADALLAMKKFTLKDGYLAKVKCPVLVSSAGQSLYLEPSVDATHILEDLAHLPENQKSLWVASAPEEGGLQAKVGAFGLAAQRIIQFLDEQLDMKRASLN